MTSDSPTPAPGTKGGERFAATTFLLSAAAAIALAVVYARGGNVQAEGALILVCFGALGAGLVTVAHRILSSGPYAEEREPLPTTPEERQAFGHDFERGEGVTRRRFLTGSLLAALGAIGAALVFPIRSLGPSPGTSLERTPWRRGSRLVTQDGAAVRAGDVPLNSLLTVFPEDAAGSADGQTVLVRVRPELLHPPPERADWSPDGFIAYSKVCTHAGCPVGLYQASTHQLLCPCHQSAFDVLNGAEPVIGPAARALPQLPIEIDAQGFLVARRDYLEPIGPAFWNRS
ncbi:MAG TPA: Rieske (2Fe-2S) protein [Acidimicrobiia bacterium]|jgi:ubiquinol-cytochrome c reductase iron-sulfur subunit